MSPAVRPRLRSLDELKAYRGKLAARPKPAKVAHVCGDTGCRAGGGKAVLEALRARVAERGLADVEVRRVGCRGFCSRGPVVVVEPGNIFYQLVEPGDAQDIVEKTLVGGQGDTGRGKLSVGD